MKPSHAEKSRPVHCAVYTRKSTDEGLDKDFNTLIAQREAGEAYIQSQAAAGWVCLPDRYDDGGFTGANLERPALQRLLADIAAGKVHCVVLSRIDRLSRSLLDFARLMETFERHHVAFVSVSQQVNSATSMGRLMLNVLLSFAQFERELIGERTRDKIAAARRKGKWVGGMPLLGYDVDPRGAKLVVNEAEAVRVRAIFNLYLEHQALLPVVQELDRRGWKTKQWTTRTGKTRGGMPFTRTNLYHLLTRVALVGRVQYKQETHPGEHEAIVDPELWERVQTVLRRHGRRDPRRSPAAALLQGLLRCAGCGCRMVPTYCLSKATTRYRYYRCGSTLKRGARTCRSKAVSARTIEPFVIEQVRALANDPARFPECKGPDFEDGEMIGVDGECLRLIVDPSWEQLAAPEQAAILRGWVQGVDFDGVNGKVRITFRRAGLLALASREVAR
jgi:site-specific DNA recombinase